MLRVDDVWKTYGDIAAVAGVSLELPRAATLGIIGPNGSGKTTLLRMIATMVKPSFGALRVCGFDALRSPAEVRRRVSLMPAEAAAPLDMTIGEYMHYFACAVDIPRRDRARRVHESLALLDMAGREETVIRGLSTGNRQRLLLAKTLLGDPELLLLDEPASGLDPRARIEIRGFLKELASLGKTIVISSHILADLEDICSDICILEEGRQQASGTLTSLRNALGAAACRRLRLAVDDVPRAEAALAGRPELLGCEVVDGRLILECRAGSANPLLAALIAADVEIQGFGEVHADLEAIFLQRTRGVVS